MDDLVIFSITENRDVSSENNCGLDPKSSDKSGPSIEPYGTPTSIAAHEEYCPFRATLAIDDIRSLSQHLTNYLIYRFL